jgi:uncharacterized protein YecA (UPF0149 family)
MKKKISENESIDSLVTGVGDTICASNVTSGFIDLATYDQLEKQENLPKKIDRNEHCPCGSGIKYKKCHGRNN